MTYFGKWESKEDVAAFFDIELQEIEDCEIIFAEYIDEDYVGNAFVLYRKDKRLYEVNGNHCSCYGLEGQWEPEETLVEAIFKRLRWSNCPELRTALTNAGLIIDLELEILDGKRIQSSN